MIMKVKKSMMMRVIPMKIANKIMKVFLKHLNPTMRNHLMISLNKTMKY